MLKIIHAADLHLDSAFAALNNEQARARRAHQRQLVQKMVEIGNEEQVDIILLAGDLFDGQNAYYETAEALKGAFAKSCAQIFISPGNHDAYTRNSPYRSVKFSDNVHIFTSEEIERVALTGLNCVVYGAGFTTDSCEKSLLEGFKANDDAIKLMVLHGEITNSPSKYNPITTTQIADSNLTYLALGHVHATEGVLCAGSTHYAYSGAPEGRGFDETGEKGIYIGTVCEERVNLEFRKISPYLYTDSIIDVENNNLEMNLQGDHRYEVCRLILEGVCEGIDASALQAKYENNFYKLTIIDRTTPPYDIWEAAHEESVKGMFLRRLKALKIDDEIRERAARYGIAAIENREGVR